MPDGRFDLAIVGAGFSGPILAAKIAEEGVHPVTGRPLTIALIDAGPYYRAPARPGYGAPVRRRAFTNLEEDAQEAYLWNRDRSLARIVGGSSLHWAGSAFLPTPADYLHWQQETGLDWTERSLAEAVEEIRREFNIHPGPPGIDTPGNRLFREAARRLGLRPERTRVARRNCIYCGFCLPPAMCKYDSRASTLWSYLPRAERQGVSVLSDTYVRRIRIEAGTGRGTARGLVCESNGSSFEISAGKVLLSCGYLNTPLLLMRSGYGPALWKRNPIRIENPNIGAHIDGHPFAPPVSAVFDEPLGDGRLGSIVGDHILDDTREDGEGRLLMTAAFGVSSSPARDALNPMSPLYGGAHKAWMKENRVLHTGTLSLRVVKPSGRWSIDEAGGLIYGGDQTLTLRRMREGRDQALRIMERMGARAVSAPEPSAPAARARGEHRVGSCRAGTDPATSVVNPHFESHEVENLLICDGSVMPRTTSGPSGTPQAALTVFAARRILQRHFRSG